MTDPVTNTTGVLEISIKDQDKEEKNFYNWRQNRKWPQKGEVEKKVTFELHIQHKCQSWKMAVKFCFIYTKNPKYYRAHKSVQQSSSTYFVTSSLMEWGKLY